MNLSGLTTQVLSVPNQQTLKIRADISVAAVGIRRLESLKYWNGGVSKLGRAHAFDLGVRFLSVSSFEPGVSGA